MAWRPSRRRSAQDAASYPSKPIRVVIPFPPGGATDLITRKIGEELTKRWNQPVVVENKPGANTIIGTETVAKAEPDGYTLLMTSPQAWCSCRRCSRSCPTIRCRTSCR